MLMAEEEMRMGRGEKMEACVGDCERWEVQYSRRCESWPGLWSSSASSKSQSQNCRGGAPRTDWSFLLHSKAVVIHEISRTRNNNSSMG